MNAVLSGLLTGLLAAGPAAAQAPLRLVPRSLPGATSGAPKVLVVAVALDGDARSHAPWLAFQGEQAVARTNRFAAVDLADGLDAEGARARAAKAEEGVAELKAGQHAYDDELDPQKALQHFDKALRALEASDLSENFAHLSKARVMKVASLVANGEKKAAELEAEKVLALDPRATFPPNYFPPEFISFVEKTRKAVLAQADGAIDVSTNDVPAQVFVNGQFKGVSPVKVTGLPRADQYVTVRAPGYARANERAREGEVHVTLEPTQAAPRVKAAMDRASRDSEGAGRDAVAVELGQLVGAEQVLMLLARGGSGKQPLEVTALRLEVSDGHNAGYATGFVPMGEGQDEAAQAMLDSVVGTDAPRVGGKPVTHFGSGGSALSGRTTGFVLMAAGAALLAGGVYFGLEASSRADKFKGLAQTDPRAEDTRSEGKTFALIADVGMVAGLASAGVGTWMAFFRGKDSGGGSVASAAVAPEPLPESRPEVKPVRETAPTTPTTPPPAAKPVREAVPMPPPPKPRESTTVPASTTRADDDRKAREEASRREREQEEARQREEKARLQREEETRRQREEETRRQREEEDRKRQEAEQRKREEEKKKKRPSIDDDDLRNY
ncbi:PEGA domain-containing protein [Myxococcaceae bacterium GXIMD 01537]